MRIVSASALAAGLIVLAASAEAATGSVGATPQRSCVQLSATPVAPLRPSGREVRIVTYTIVHTLGIDDEEVSHPAFFVFPRERSQGCEAAAPAPGRARNAASPPGRGRGELQGR